MTRRKGPEARGRRRLSDGSLVVGAAAVLATSLAILLAFAVPDWGEASALEVADVAGSAGISEVTLSWSADVGDFNNDRWDDVLLGRHWKHPARLYKNVRGRFVEVNPGTFVKADRHDCAWSDVDRDRRPDVYCTLGANDEVTGDKANELWIQQPDGTFVNQGGERGVGDPYGRGRDTTFVDVNRDGHPDLFVGNRHPRPDGLPTPNRLFVNEGGGNFRGAPEYGLDLEMGGHCVEAADYNKDGWDDLLVCGQEVGLRLFRNDEGVSFTDVTDSVGMKGWWSDAELVDLNDDGWLDLVQVRKLQFQVSLQIGGLFKRQMVMDMTAGNKIATGDVTRDNRPDVYVLQGCLSDGVNYPDVMLLNDGAGTSFSETPIPQATTGCGDAVSALDYDRNGRSDFIVLNGQAKTEGPVQLISFR